MNKTKLSDLLKNNPSNQNCEYKAYNDYNWSVELDEFLKPYEEKAKETGILMTPVLIINGKLKHYGSMPALRKINDWLNETKQ